MHVLQKDPVVVQGSELVPRPDGEDVIQPAVPNTMGHRGDLQGEPVQLGEDEVYVDEFEHPAHRVEHVDGVRKVVVAAVVVVRLHELAEALDLLLRDRVVGDGGAAAMVGGHPSREVHLRPGRGLPGGTKRWDRP